ncbi:MAG TPA: VWA domain-containing protein [Gemmataceae bacterium]|nr:VWA domain-containing protein [Gemmataceae bacterium]
MPALPAPPAAAAPAAKEPMTGEVKQNTEAYDHIVENAFLAADRNPLSTFSIDVDTASYSNVRRFLLSEDRLPPPDAVRIEELINYFPYRYPQPKDGHPVAFALDITECPWNAKHYLVRIGLMAKRIDPNEMPPRNFVFLVDTSGSMNAPNRLPLLQQSLHLLVDQLNERDRVAIVAYAGSAGLVLPSTPGNRKETIRNAIDRLQAGGSTNGGEGITLAYGIAENSFVPDGLNRVILGTDGDFNVGVTSQGDLVRLIEEKRKSGVYLTVLGFGMGNLKDSMMEKLSHHGNGHYAYIDSEAEARKVFIEQGAALVTVAKDVKLQIEFNPQRVGAYRLIGYEDRLLQAHEFNDDKKDAGDMGSGHTVTALYEIIPPGQPLPGAKVDALKYQQSPIPTKAADNGEWLTVKLRYKDPDAETSKLLSKSLTGAARALSQMPQDFRFASAVASFGMLLRNSEYRGTATYASVRKLAASAVGADRNSHRAEFLELVDAAQRLDLRAAAKRGD